MVFPLPNQESNAVSKFSKSRVNKKQRKQKKRAVLRLAKRTTGRNLCTSSMSAWAEHFTAAATWQLQHQLAYWKAKAISLQYENSVLQEVIQQNQMVLPSTSQQNEIKSEPVTYNGKPLQQDIQTEESIFEENNTEGEFDNDDLQIKNLKDVGVAPDFFKFIYNNALNRALAKHEKEQLKAEDESEAEKELHSNAQQESIEDKIAWKKELYGDKYQKIIALEMYLMTNFKNESDKLKPQYWPCIALNL